MSVKSDVRWGLNIGFKVAVLYAIVGSVVLMIGQAPSAHALLLIAAYFAAGVTSGALLGLLRNLASQSRFAAVLAGTIIAFPAVALMSGILGVVENDPLPLPGIVILALLFGIVGGLHFGPEKS